MAAAPDAGPGAAAASLSSGGGADFRRGWTLYLDHCAECHGDGRRGDGERSSRLEDSPADLRNPLLLGARTDDQLAKAIAQGGAFVGKSKAMPAFHKELSERDILDLLAYLRGDALALEDCFPGATLWSRLSPPGEPETLMAVYTVPGDRSGRARISGDESLQGATLIGLALFTDVELPRAGLTPIALLAEPSGALRGVRVGLPPKDREKAQRDLEADLRQGGPDGSFRVPASARLASLLGKLSAAARGVGR